MPSQLTVRAENHGGMLVTAGDGVHGLTMDYPMPGADSDALAGLTPLRVLLASLAGCSANSMAVLLRKMRQPLSAVEVEACGLRRDEHPTVFTEISLTFTVRGAGVDSAAVQKALTLSEEQICPVWAMLKPGTPIAATFTVVEDRG